MQKQQLQNLVITGANEGIGFQTMRNLYLTGKYNIVFGSRNMQRNQQAKQKVLKQFNHQNPNSKTPLLSYFQLDLSSKQSIENFVTQVKKCFQKVHVLINNAGALFNQKQVVKQLSFNVQKTLLINYFSVFYLIYQFFNQKLIFLNTNEETRIINVSSSAHAYCQNGMLEDLTCTQKHYSTYRQYSIAKFFVTAFTKQMSTKLQRFYENRKQKQKIKIVSLHPGVINTNIGSDVMLAKIIKFVSRLWMKNNEQGAKSSITLSRMKFEQLRNGGYYNEEGKQTKADKRTNDNEIGQKLWRISEQGWGIKFQI